MVVHLGRGVERFFSFLSVRAGDARICCVNLECRVADGLIVSASDTTLNVTLTDVDATVKRRVWVATESNCDAMGGGFESYHSVLNDHFDSENGVNRY